MELLRLHRSDGMNMDPIPIKNIVMSQERQRIQEDPTSQFLNLDDGNQQCVRDMFLSLTVNMIGWPDLFTFFSFQLTEETKCGNPSCHLLNSSDHDPQLYFELDVPPHGSDLSYYVEQALSESSPVDNYHCELQVLKK